MTTTSASLLDRLRQPGEDHAWARFVELYTPLLLRWAAAVGLQESDAADLVQEVFVLLLGKLPGFQYNPERSFRAWLRTVMLNLWRQRRRREARLAKEECAAEVPDPSVDEPFWETEYRRDLARRALQIMQRDFDETTWQAFWGCVVEGRSAPEVGRALGLNPGAVRAAKFRVQYRLRRELDGLLE
jgi:RNA polymerase sigma-70 factor (ECF subfamily)